MRIVQSPSPNFDTRDGHAIDMLVLHYTGMMTAQGALEKLCNGNAERKVSAHYMVDEDGTIYALVPEEMRAWHAGVSFWRGHSNINQRSIGIEIVNPGHEYGYRPFPQIQMDAVAELAQGILARHTIPARNVVGHSDIAPERKEDPGEFFNWKFLAEQGVGIFPKQVDGGWWIVNGEMNSAAATNHRPLTTSHLQQYGYSTTDMAKTITAFQRHFRPNLLTGLWDEECGKILSALLDSKL